VLQELLELDQWYGWSVRHSAVRYILEPPRERVWPYLLAAFFIILAILLIGAGVYIYVLG